VRGGGGKSQGVEANGKPKAQVARNSPYTTEDVETALSVVAYHSGNARKASRALEAAGQRVPESTLKLWRGQTFAERYRQIETEELPRRYQRIASRCEEIADQAADVEEQLIEQLRDKASELPVREVANALRNASTTKAINVDKSLLVRGRPTEIHAHADVTEVLKNLSERFAGKVEVSRPLIGSAEDQRGTAAEPAA